MPHLVTIVKDVHQMAVMQGMARLHAIAKEYIDDPKQVTMSTGVHTVEIMVGQRCVFFAIKQLPTEVWTIKAAEHLVPHVRASLQQSYQQRKNQNARSAACV